MALPNQVPSFELFHIEVKLIPVQSWIIDGFPRTLHQGELLDQVLLEEVRLH